MGRNCRFPWFSLWCLGERREEPHFEGDGFWCHWRADLCRLTFGSLQGSKNCLILALLIRVRAHFCCILEWIHVNWSFWGNRNWDVWILKKLTKSCYFVICIHKMKTYEIRALNETRHKEIIFRRKISLKSQNFNNNFNHWTSHLNQF